MSAMMGAVWGTSMYMQASYLYVYRNSLILPLIVNKRAGIAFIGNGGIKLKGMRLLATPHNQPD